MTRSWPFGERRNADPDPHGAVRDGHSANAEHRMIGDSDQPGDRPAGVARSGCGGRARALRRRPERLNLALQGGGAHGAFTWGVLVRLLEAEIRIEGISGASAGALNAVALASGWLCGGAAGAVRALDELWREIARLAQMSRLRAGGLTQLAADFAAQFLSPYQLNPMGVNPLRPVLERLVEFERLRAVELPRLFIAATNVATARDVLLVQINPLRAERLPRTPREIRNRIAEIAFGRPLAEELERLQQRAGAAFAPLNWLTRRRRRLARHRV